MLHSHVELRHLRNDIGYGLVATRFIPRGTITWAMCALERVFEPAEYASMPAAYRPYLNKYTYSTSSGSRILCCDLGRYINHSCMPNSITLPDVEVEVAIKDIFPGDQLTDDYGTLNLTEDLECLCGSPNCRGVVRGDDALRYREQWEFEAFSAMASSSRVPQPLASFVDGGLEAYIEKISPSLTRR